MTRPGAAGSLVTAHRRAVVIGGGWAGMLTAAALDGLADEITVVERDTLPPGPEPRAALPQARHAHLLRSGGVRACEELLPGVTARWRAAGAHRVPLPTGLVTLSAQGWLRRWPETHFALACSRDLLDWVVREEVLDRPAVTLLRGCAALGLTGTARRVTGVRATGADGRELLLGADLVVDASGRDSPAPRWLAELGGRGRVQEIRVDAGLVCATRLYRAPAGSAGFPVVSVQADPAAPAPGRTATLVPIEGDRWMVTLSGARGGEPSSDPAEFEPFARSAVRHPLVGELISGAVPLSDEVALTRITVDRRRFEKTAGRPDGFIAVGDSVAAHHPLLGQGLSVAARSLVELRRTLRGHRLDEPGLARRAQRALARPVATAWRLAAAQDLQHPGSALAGLGVARLSRAATGRARLARAHLGVLALAEPPSSWLHPDLVVAALRGPGRAALTGPPLTAWERRIAARGKAPEADRTPDPL
ncbi:hypothetical protein GCM10010387_28850 [Streptomyces inusitatus]|uniref:FAD-binding domain-containing protein n=1 Tax=Streptomyces inusitatus TaxID=68221 RepID=A0A918UU25_9ACTN|nr:FAD-dependent monooxygenase [Streptomyces inusitatus]GGZ32968.1 hypothetical protein GCM10010387_28850 [Streptomyces inusitatus]